jgi:hypothetical protein
MVLKGLRKLALLAGQNFSQIAQNRIGGGHLIEFRIGCRPLHKAVDVVLSRIFGPVSTNERWGFFGMTCNQIRFVHSLSETMAKILRSNVSGFAAQSDKILGGRRRTGNLGEGGSRHAQQRDASACYSKSQFHEVLRKSGGDWYWLVSYVEKENL